MVSASFIPPVTKKQFNKFLVASVVAKFEQILWVRFGNILKQSVKGHKNSK